MSFKLWGRYTSARTLKVNLALAELGIDYQLIMASATMGPGGSVQKGNQPYGVVNTPEYFAMNPNRRVPTIDDNGFVLWESNTIVQYLGMKYDPELFYGNDIYTFASASRWLGFEEHNLNPAQNKMAVQLYRLPEEQRDPDILKQAYELHDQEFAKLESQLGKTEYICGDRWTMGDIGIGLRVYRWYQFDVEHPPLPNIERYCKTIQARPAFSVVMEPAYHQT